jgi:alpha-N-acetylglucosamine transferase
LDVDSGISYYAKRNQYAELSKLHAWTFTQYKNVVFLDADTMVYQPAADDLFALPECSYAPGAAESFNSGLFTVSPSMQTFNELVDIVSN